MHNEKYKLKDTQEMPESQSTTFPRQHKKERRGTNNDQTNATYEQRTNKVEVQKRNHLGTVTKLSSHRCPDEETLHSWLSKMRPSEDSDLNLRLAHTFEDARTFSDAAHIFEDARTFSDAVHISEDARTFSDAVHISEDARTFSDAVHISEDARTFSDAVHISEDARTFSDAVHISEDARSAHIRKCTNVF